MRKLAGTAVLLGGLCSVYVGGYNDADYLESRLLRFVFFTAVAVLIVAGFEHWKMRSLPMALRILSGLLVLAGAVLAGGVIVSFGLFSAVVAVVMVAVARRYLTRPPLPLLCGVAVTLFAGYAAFSPYSWDEALAACVPVTALATFCAFVIGRERNPGQIPAPPASA